MYPLYKRIQLSTEDVELKLVTHGLYCCYRSETVCRRRRMARRRNTGNTGIMTRRRPAAVRGRGKGARRRRKKGREASVKWATWRRSSVRRSTHRHSTPPPTRLSELLSYCPVATAMVYIARTGKICFVRNYIVTPKKITVHGKTNFTRSGKSYILSIKVECPTLWSTQRQIRPFFHMYYISNVYVRSPYFGVHI